MISKVSLVLMFAILSLSVRAQETDLTHTAPTLQVGLDGLNFAKGTLDAQLIMEIIGEKQRELKVKLVQNMLLSKLDSAGGLMYNFADNVLRGVLLETDPKVRTRKVLESTVNVVFVTLLADYYLRTLPSDVKNLEHQAVIRLLHLYGLDSVAFKQHPGLFGLKKDRAQAGSDNDGQVRAWNGDAAASFVALMLDMASEVVKENTKLKDLGILQVSHSITYEFLNEYRWVQTYANKEKWKKIQDDYLTSLKKKPEDPLDSAYKVDRKVIIDVVDDQLMYATAVQSRKVFDCLKSKLESLTDYIGLVYYIIDEDKFRHNATDLISFIKDETVTGLSNVQDFSSDSALLKNVFVRLQNSLTNISTKQAYEKSEAVEQLMIMQSYLRKADRYFKSKKTVLDAGSILSDVVFSIRGEFLPLVRKYGHLDSTMTTLNRALDDFCVKLAGRAVSVLGKYSGATFLDDEKIDPYLRLIATLYKFDRAATFSDYVKLADQLKEVFGNDSEKDAIALIVGFVKDFTMIKLDDDGKEVVEFNVENFLLRLQSINRDKWSAWQFHFTVGTNTIYFKKPIPIGGNETMKNFSFVGEKIGVKFKLADWGFWMPKNPGETYKYGCYTYTKLEAPREPIVSNFHLLAYASGLLYNLTNLKNEDSFTSPLVAGGFGLTFTNALDFNLSIGMPLMKSLTIKESSKHYYFGVGFDIQFTEYINRLNQKRQAAKTQKALLKAAESAN